MQPMPVCQRAVSTTQAMVSFPEIANAGPAVQRMMALLHPPEGGSAKQVLQISTGAGDGGHEQQQQQQAKQRGRQVGSLGALVAQGSILNLRGHVALQHVCFSYPTRPDVRVLEDFSLEIPAGVLAADPRGVVTCCCHLHSGRADTCLTLMLRPCRQQHGPRGSLWQRQEHDCVAAAALLRAGARRRAAGRRRHPQPGPGVAAAAGAVTPGIQWWQGLKHRSALQQLA